MYKVFYGLYVGTLEDIPCAVRNDISILGVCKDPLHRQHARLRGAYADGYITKSMPVDEPEYLFAKRRNALYCNLIDAPDHKYISDVIIDTALDFIDDEHIQGKEVLIVCNHAKSRSPSIALMWMIRHGYITESDVRPLESVMDTFRRLYYPKYEPGAGFVVYTMKFWKENKVNGKEKKDSV